MILRTVRRAAASWSGSAPGIPDQVVDLERRSDPCRRASCQSWIRPRRDRGESRRDLLRASDVEQESGDAAAARARGCVSAIHDPGGRSRAQSRARRERDPEPERPGRAPATLSRSSGSEPSSASGPRARAAVDDLDAMSGVPPRGARARPARPTDADLDRIELGYPERRRARRGDSPTPSGQRRLLRDRKSPPRVGRAKSYRSAGPLLAGRRRGRHDEGGTDGGGEEGQQWVTKAAGSQAGASRQDRSATAQPARGQPVGRRAHEVRRNQRERQPRGALRRASASETATRGGGRHLGGSIRRWVGRVAPRKACLSCARGAGASFAPSSAVRQPQRR